MSLDLATKTGWAVQTPSGIEHGVKNWQKYKKAGLGLVLVKYRDWLETMFVQHSVTSVAVEQPVAMHGLNNAIAHALYYMTIYACYVVDMPLCDRPPSKIKKYITGKGNAGKDMVIQAIKDMGYEPKDDNDADAIALLLMVMDEKEQAEHGPENDYFL